MSSALFFISNNLPWVWLVLMVVFIVVEAMTFALTTVWFAAGSCVMIFLSLLPLSFRWQVLIFLVISFALLFLTRPILTKKLNAYRQNKTNIDAVIGSEVLVTEKISKFEKGAVRLNGVLWSAESKDSELEIDAGSVCKIVEVRGNTLVVEKKQDVSE